MERITTWQQAFKELKEDVTLVDRLRDALVKLGLSDGDVKMQIAQYILPRVAKVLNGKWIPDYTNRSQWKYKPVFIVNTTKDNVSGSGLSCDGYERWHTHTSCGVRLCYCDSDTAKYAGTQFKELYEDLYLIRE